MPRLVAALLLKNEASPERFLRPVMARLELLCDQIVVVDDGSTDDTVELCRGFGAEVIERDPEAPQAWGSEAQARAELWSVAVQRCGPKDWLVFCDGDMVLCGDPRPLMASRETNAVAWPLFDCWGEKVYRSDDMWRGHLFPRVWMVKPYTQPLGWQSLWERPSLHVGHIPSNFAMLPMIAPPDIFWLHQGYSTPASRQQAYNRYKEKAHLLTDGERAHAESILQEP